MSTIRPSKDEEVVFKIYEEMRKRKNRDFTIRELAAILGFSTYSRVLPNHPLFIQLVKDDVLAKNDGMSEKINEPTIYHFDENKYIEWLKKTQTEKSIFLG